MSSLLASRASSMELLGKKLQHAFLAISLILWAPSTFGQEDDIFGGQPGAAANNVVEPIGNQFEIALRRDLSRETDPVVKSLLSDPPTTPKELGRAIRLMLRIKRYDEVERWLQAISRLNLNEEVSSVLVDNAGPRTFITISEIEGGEIAESSKALAKRIVELSSGVRISPATLSQLAEQMRSRDSSVRLAGYQGISSAGRAGLQEFFANIMAAGAPMPTPIMCEALAKWDEPAWEAWNEAIRTTHSDAQFNLAVLAFGSRDPKFLVPLASVITASDPSDSAWEPLRKAWRVSEKTTEQSIYKQAITNLNGELALHRRTRFENQESTSLVWRLRDDGRSLELVDGRSTEVMFQRLLSSANSVLRLSKQPDRDSALAYAVLAEGLSTQQSFLELQSLIAPFRETPAFFCLALDLADEQDLGKAQAVILEEFNRFLVPLTSDVRERLLRSLDSGYRVVRYRAASTLMNYLQSLPEEVASTALPSRGKLDRVARELLAAKAKPVAFVVGSSSSLRDHTKSLLTSLNFHVYEFGTAREVLTAAKQGVAADRIFLVSSVYEVSLAQLVQRLRAVPVTSRAAIIMLADRLNQAERELLSQDGRVIFGSVPPEAVGIKLLLDRLSAIDSQTPVLTFADRIVWAENAERYLQRFTTD